MIAGELPRVLGLDDEPQTFVPRILATLSDIGAAGWRTVGISAACLVVLFAGSDDLGEGCSWHSISQAVAAACQRLGIEDEEPPEWTGGGSSG